METQTDFCKFENINNVNHPDDLLKFLEEKLKSFPAILQRDFLSLEENYKNDTNVFRVMQWNTLAKALCTSETNIRAPSDSLDWSKYRLWRTLQEITRHGSDIICIEEIDSYEQIKPYLLSIGYTSIFCPKFSSPCLEFNGNVGPDGCAIFYRLSMFQIQNMSCEKIITNNEVNSQAFIILQLKHKPTEKLITIVCLHLKSGVANFQKREDQIREILKTIKIHLRGSRVNIHKHPLIICGDFNGEPFEKFYDLIVNDHDIPELRDAYSEIGKTKQPTTIKMRWQQDEMIRRGIDYIFFNRSSIKLVGYLKLPENNKLIDENGLPNLEFSSDHISLVCDFKL